MAGKPTNECYETLITAFDYFNGVLFKRQLPDVIITFHRQRKIMGYASIGRWVNNVHQYVDELAVNPEYFAKYPLIEICQTLCHEMVHIWQAHFGNPGRRGYHNIQWARKMSAIGLIPSSTGKPGGQKTGEYVMDYVLHDGPFHQACRELINSGYSIPWVDRYPVFRLDLPVLAYDQQGGAIELNAKLLAKSKLSASASAAMKKQDAAAIELADRLGSVFDGDVDDDDDFVLPISSKPRSRSGRVKYACKTCQIQLWGKPGLHVVCGECEIKLQEIV
jgi:predicted SprT family Zn-dependent metalloprotease